MFILIYSFFITFHFFIIKDKNVAVINIFLNSAGHLWQFNMSKTIKRRGNTFRLIFSQYETCLTYFVRQYN